MAISFEYIQKAGVTLLNSCLLYILVTLTSFDCMKDSAARSEFPAMQGLFSFFPILRTAFYGNRRRHINLHYLPGA
jgi:hypothetical protein